MGDSNAKQIGLLSAILILLVINTISNFLGQPFRQFIAESGLMWVAVVIPLVIGFVVYYLYRE